VRNTNLPPWVSGTTYRIKSRGIDNVTLPTGTGNIETPSGDRVFMYDDVKPDTFITFPVEGESYRTKVNLAGTCIDSHSGIDEVYVRLYDSTDGEYWDGNSWEVISATNAWIIATGTDSWTYTHALLTYETAHNYSVNAKAVDNVPNMEVDFSTVTFFYDDEAPVSEIEEPANGDELNTLVQINGTAEDITSLTDKIEIRISDISENPNEYWTGVAWSTSPAWVDTIGSGAGVVPWFYDITSETATWIDGHSYSILSRAHDNIGNIETPGAATSFLYSMY